MSSQSAPKAVYAHQFWAGRQLLVANRVYRVLIWMSCLLLLLMVVSPLHTPSCIKQNGEKKEVVYLGLCLLYIILNSPFLYLGPMPFFLWFCKSDEFTAERTHFTIEKQMKISFLTKKALPKTIKCAIKKLKFIA